MSASHARPRLHFVSHGDGFPVLAVHGWTPDHRLMTGCLEPVFAHRSGYRRLYPDLPGMGRSPAGTAASSDDVLAALDDFIAEHIGAESFLVIGESYGGYLARAIACARPQQVRGLALICPVGTAVRRANRTLPPHTVIEADPQLIAGLPEADADYPDVAVIQNAETLRRFRDEVRPGLALADTAALERIARRWELSAEPEAAGGFDGPSLILTGRQDSSTGFADTYPLLPHYPRASFAVLDRAGHNLQFERPELFDSLMAEWLDRVGV